jgi:hypothetical protein
MTPRTPIGCPWTVTFWTSCGCPQASAEFIRSRPKTQRGGWTGSSRPLRRASGADRPLLPHIGADSPSIADLLQAATHTNGPLSVPRPRFSRTRATSHGKRSIHGGFLGRLRGSDSVRATSMSRSPSGLKAPLTGHWGVSQVPCMMHKQPPSLPLPPGDGDSLTMIQKTPGTRCLCSSGNGHFRICAVSGQLSARQPPSSHFHVDSEHGEIGGWKNELQEDCECADIVNEYHSIILIKKA